MPNYHDDNLPGASTFRTNDDAPVGRNNPIELYADKEVLKTLLRATITEIKRNRIVEIETADERAANDAILNERVRLLEWLDRYPERHVFTALYIASEFEDGDGEDNHTNFPPFGSQPMM